jgi:hypothetical protein
MTEQLGSIIDSSWLVHIFNDLFEDPGAHLFWRQFSGDSYFLEEGLGLGLISNQTNLKQVLSKFNFFFTFKFLSLYKEVLKFILPGSGSGNGGFFCFEHPYKIRI